MSEIPDDIRKAAKACYEACEYGDSGEIVDCIGEAISAERERCASIVENSGEVSVRTDAREKLASIIRGES